MYAVPKCYFYLELRPTGAASGTALLASFGEN